MTRPQRRILALWKGSGKWPVGVVGVAAPLGSSHGSFPNVPKRLWVWEEAGRASPVVHRAQKRIVSAVTCEFEAN